MIQLAREYRAARDRLISHRGNRFQPRRLVHVDCPRYLGLGAIAVDSECPLDHVPVLLGNGNVWWYPVESCTPVDAPMPRALRHAILDKARINHL